MRRFMHAVRFAVGVFLQSATDRCGGIGLEGSALYKMVFLYVWRGMGMGMEMCGGRGVMIRYMYVYVYMCGDGSDGDLWWRGESVDCIYTRRHEIYQT